MLNKLQDKTEERICEILDAGIQTNNLEMLGELIDVDDGEDHQDGED